MIENATIQALKENTNIEDIIGPHVALRSRGHDLVGRCPFHEEKTGSFFVIPHKNMYYCFGCGENGDVLDWLRTYEGLTFQDAAQTLALRSGLVLDTMGPAAQRAQLARRSLKEVCSTAGGLYERSLHDAAGSDALRYLLGRGLTTQTLKEFRVGLAPAEGNQLTRALELQGAIALGVQAGLVIDGDHGPYDRFRNRVVFPICSNDHRPIGFGGRTLDDGPKYINTPETALYHKSDVLYGLNQALPHLRRTKQLILVEGYADVMAVSQLGAKDVASQCGVALTPAHARIISRLVDRVVYMSDGDEAGMASADRALPLLLDAGLEVVAPNLPAGTDPAGLLKEGYGDLLLERIQRSPPLLNRTLVRISRACAPTPSGRTEAVKQASDLISRLPPLDRAQVIPEAAATLSVNEALLRQALRRPTASEYRNQDTDPLVDSVLWLLLHHMDEVGAMLGDAEPEWFPTDDVRFVVGQLLSGESALTVADNCADDVLKASVHRLCVHDVRFPADKLVPVARDLLARLELRHVQGAMKSCINGQRLALQRRRQELMIQLRG